MKKFINKSAILIAVMMFGSMTNSYAQTSHTVVSGDSMWKIAVKYQVGLSEIISANPHISNPEMIYPGQIITIPSVDSVVTSYEKR